jgi:hypothetical protein
MNDEGHLEQLTPDRVALMAELARLSFEASRIAGPLDEAKFNWQPDDGKGWSVGQCLEHLVRSNRIYLDAMEDPARSAAKVEGHCDPQPLEPGRLGRWFVGEMEAPKRKYTSPKKSQPPSMCMKEATLVAFAGEQQRIIEFVRETACLDCNEIKFKNPFLYGLRTFNLATGLLVLAAHERRHLAQAANVVAKMASY